MTNRSKQAISDFSESEWRKPWWQACVTVLHSALIRHSDTSSVVSSSRGKEALLAGCLVLHSGKLYYTVVWEQPLLLIVVDILWKYLSPEMFWSGSGSEECFADVVSGIKRRNWTRHQQASKQSLDQWCAAMSSPHCVVTVPRRWYKEVGKWIRWGQT